MANQFFAVFDWRKDGRYHVADAYGSRVFKTLRGAQKYADYLDSPSVVVRSSGFIGTHHATIENGKIRLMAPCPCPSAPHNVIAGCPFHAAS